MRSGNERAGVAARAREVLAATLGASYHAAANGAHRRPAEVVAKLVARFNREGLAVLEPHGRGGPKPTYDAQARERTLAEARRAPDPELDGTASWSLIEAAPGLGARRPTACPM